MKKALKIILIVVVVLLAAFIAIPFIFKDKIVARVKAGVNENINAKVDFGDFDLTLFKNFPHLTLKLEKLSVVGIDAFEGDTLAGVGMTAITLDIMSVISGGQIEILGVELDDARLQFLVLEDGKANWDIVKPDTVAASQPEKPTQFKAALNHYSISDGYLVYDDKSLGFNTTIRDFELGGKGDFTQDLFTMKMEMTAAALSLSYGGVGYINEVRSRIQADLEMDMVNSKYTFKQNEFQLNELVLGLDGFVAMPAEDINMDLKFDVKQNDFKTFMSMIPGMYREGFDKVESSGKLAFNGYAKGTYSETTIPGFGITLAIDDGKFRYPDLPAAISNVQVDLKVSNPDGVPDHTLINLEKFHAEIGNDPVDARLVVKTPVSDADIDATIKGRIDLGTVNKLVPLEEGTSMSGIMNANVTAKGKLSTLEKKEFQNFNASGNILLNNFNYKSKDLSQGVIINICELIFNPKNITLNQLDMKTGKTDIRATGWLDNLLTYMFRENEMLKGTLSIKSNVIDFNELMGNSATSSSPADTTPMEIVEVPENIDFLISAEAGRIYYDDMVLENLTGNVAIRDRSMGINQVNFGMLGGRITMDGLYETKNIKAPNFFFDLNVSQLNIRKTFDTFIAVQKLAPIAKQCTGTYSADFDVRGMLNNRMEPDLNSFTGGGKLATNNVVIENFEPLVKISEALKMEQFKKLEPDDVNLSFKFENGRVNIEPFTTKIDDITAVTQGSNGFDQTIDYNIDMKIPTKMMGSSANNAITGILAKANSKAGTNMSMGNEITVNVKVKGTVTDPVVETGIKDLAKTVAVNVKEELEAKKKELEDKAKAEAERLKKEAEDKAKAEAERLKKEAEEKAKKETDKIKKEAEEKIKKQADDKLKDLFGKPK